MTKDKLTNLTKVMATILHISNKIEKSGMISKIAQDQTHAVDTVTPGGAILRTTTATGARAPMSTETGARALTTKELGAKAHTRRGMTTTTKKSPQLCLNVMNAKQSDHCTHFAPKREQSSPQMSPQL